MWTFLQLPTLSKGRRGWRVGTLFLPGGPERLRIAVLPHAWDPGLPDLQAGVAVGHSVPGPVLRGRWPMVWSPPPPRPLAWSCMKVTGGWKFIAQKHVVSFEFSFFFSEICIDFGKAFPIYHFPLSPESFLRGTPKSMSQLRYRSRVYANHPVWFQNIICKGKNEIPSKNDFAHIITPICLHSTFLLISPPTSQVLRKK